MLAVIESSSTGRNERRVFTQAAKLKTHIAAMDQEMKQ